MNALTALGAWSHHGFGSLGSTLAHAAIWSFVGRLIWHAPILLAVVAVACAGLYLVFRGRGDARR